MGYLSFSCQHSSNQLMLYICSCFPPTAFRLPRGLVQLQMFMLPLHVVCNKVAVYAHEAYV